MSPTIGAFRKNTLRPVLTDPAFSVVVAVIDDRPQKSAGQRLRNNLRRGRGGYVIVMALRNLASRLPSANPAPASAQENTETYCKRHGIEVHRTNRPYGTETLTKVRNSELDALVLVDGFGIVKKGMIDAAPRGVVSYHHGDMRNYRGMPMALWELYNEETEMGATVQLLTPGLDNGRPLVEMTIPIEKGDDVDRLTERALRMSEPMLHAALTRLANPEFVPPEIEEFGKVYTLPDLRQWLRLQYRIWKRK
ncbi:formyltransferase family protein [Neolewinella antarctica]|uniref:phosphoribosylglycinamide formyltransferase 1 n=1 Tax=Neolewinella antarctica TaxID=442734 RepID=A0ABX0XA98_9BACT|nr:formyltransferase family protein [Neolewinella antarctica]NJC25879.1 folate-dependent phosphoribosylglycinamide formyltransferase PurN [Neolewinella antarctica]